MQTPGSLAFNSSLGVPGTGPRGALSSQPTPATLRRPDLGQTSGRPRADLGHHYIGFRVPPGSAGRRSSLMPSVRQAPLPRGVAASVELLSHGDVGFTAAGPLQESVPLSSNDIDGDADQTFIWGTNLSGAHWCSNNSQRCFRDPTQPLVFFPLQ